MKNADPQTLPLILPLGDRGLLVRFSGSLSDAANRAAVEFAHRVGAARLPGVLEVVPNLVSVLLRYDPGQIEFDRLAGEVRLVAAGVGNDPRSAQEHAISVSFDGEDLAEVSALLHLEPTEFIAAHCAAPLRVLAVGFAPGFVYCGFHNEKLHVPRRAEVRRQVEAGTVLFAAGQTAITSTPIPTGWHVIGHTGFRNFDPATDPPARLVAGDIVHFRPVS